MIGKATIGSLVQVIYFMFLFVSMSVPMGFELFYEQATELYRGYFDRPPPLPDPISKPSKRQLRALKKAELTQKRFDLVSQRLLRRQQGKLPVSHKTTLDKFWSIFDSMANNPRDDLPIR